MEFAFKSGARSLEMQWEKARVVKDSDSTLESIISVQYRAGYEHLLLF